MKKGEKVDYAIQQNGEVIILIECKQANANLSQANISQLYRYFTTTKARIVILTNGIQYRFFSDLEEPNKMDQKEFFVYSYSQGLFYNLKHKKELVKIFTDDYLKTIKNERNNILDIGFFTTN